MNTILRRLSGILVFAAVVLGGGPVSAASADLHQRLAQGEIVSEGGYLQKGVWAKMQGVVQASPEVVWELFIQANDWKRYRIPHLTDSRAVTPDVASAVSASEHVEDYYKAAGATVVNPVAGRKKGQVWVNHSFQYYNLPWPVANKWMVVKTQNDESRSAEHRFRGEWTKTAGNVRSVDGNIVIEPFDNSPQLTLMTYYATSDPGSAVPKFLLKWGLKKTMPATLEAIRREAAKVTGKPPSFLRPPE